jgi:hypothetical protein
LVFPELPSLPNSVQQGEDGSEIKKSREGLPPAIVSHSAHSTKFYNHQLMSDTDYSILQPQAANGWLANPLNVCLRFV